MFLDISKATKKVWHEGIKFTLFQNGISGELLNFLKYILKDRKKRVIMNEVPVNAFQSNLEYFDTKKSATDMNNDLKVIGKWANQWKMSFNLIL